MDQCLGQNTNYAGNRFGRPLVGNYTNNIL